MKFAKIISDNSKEPSVMKRSTAKLWIKIIILLVFGTLFSISIYKDVMEGDISYFTLVALFVPSFIIGIWLRKLVPISIYKEFSQLTFSFDKIYFAIILILFIMKKTCEYMQMKHSIADASMVIILGLMLGRIIGLSYRVARIKKEFFS